MLHQLLHDLSGLFVPLAEAFAPTALLPASIAQQGDSTATAPITTKGP
jgi:hypothetical protein